MAGARRARNTVEGERASDPGAVRAAAIALLARRDFSSAELMQRLIARGYAHEPVAAAVAELRAARVLDDIRYAEQYVSYHAARGQGPVRIAAELRQLGVEARVISAALESGPDWRALAREVRIGRFGLELPRSWAERGRQARFLQYRGFSADHIRSAVGPDFDPDT